MPLTTTPERVLGFRLRRHHLGRRLALRSLGAAATACGIRNSPPGSALTALAARVTGMSAVSAAALVEVIGPRLTPTLVLPADVAVFTVGALPPDDRSLRETLGDNTAKALAGAGLGLADAVRAAAEAARAALAGGPLARGELSAVVTAQLPPAMSAWCPRCGSRHVSDTLFRAAGAAGAYALEPRSGRGVTLRRLELPDPDPEAARLELARRFLRCYGPATPADLAGWILAGPFDARARWAALAGELAEVGWAGRTGSVLAADVAALRRGTVPAGLRLLPPGDPYLQSRDRAALVPDTAHRKRVWPSLAAPGALLLDGALAGTWRSRVQGDTLRLTVAPFGRLPASTRPALDAEAARLAPLRSCATATVATES